MSTTTPTSQAHSLLLPWGESDSFTLEFPAAWPEPEVARPDLSGSLDDYPATLATALDQPESGRRLESLVGPGTTVAIVVDDPSRWTPVREALPIVLNRLHGAGVRRRDVTISLGVGRHHAADEDALRRRVGDAVFTAYHCFSPPVDDIDQYIHLGETPQGVPVRVFRPVAEAGVRVLIGSVLPHLQAGFGGGYKLIFPGCSHRTTLGALHRQGLGEGDAARLLGGDVDTNPMRRAIRDAASLLPGSCFSISHVLGPPGQVFRVLAGDVDRVQAALSDEARHRYAAPPVGGMPADVVVAGNHPWPGDPMQSFKVLLNHRAAGRPGGVLVGLFWTDPGEIDRSFPMPAPAGDRRDRTGRRLGRAAGFEAGRPRRDGGPEPEPFPASLGSRAGRRPSRTRLCPPAPRATRPATGTGPPLRRYGRTLARR